MGARPASGAPLRGLALAALVALAAAVPARALQRPEFAAGVGGTFAVLGEPNEGGLATSLALLWPVDVGFLPEGRVSFGVTGFADDFGARLGPLLDPANPSVRIGTTELAHRWSWGAGWRMDARLASRAGWTPVVSGTWGLYRIADDLRGDLLASTGSTGWSLAGGVRRPTFGRAALGAMVRYHRLFNDVAGRFASAGLEWSW